MDKLIMLKALAALDKRLDKPTKIVIGGGAAMLLAYDIPLSTMDIDGVLVGTETMPAELDSLVKDVAKELHIHAHWFNSYFSTFTYTIPSGYEKRTKKVYAGKRLEVLALDISDLLIMKCFSGREKDIGHARVLAKRCKNLDKVENYIHELLDKGLSNARDALDFLSDIREQIGK